MKCFGEVDGSENSSSEVESWWIEGVTWYKDKIKEGIKEKVKEKIHRQTRFEDNYSNNSPATAPKMLVGIS